MGTILGILSLLLAGSSAVAGGVNNNKVKEENNRVAEDKKNQYNRNQRKVKESYDDSRRAALANLIGSTYKALPDSYVAQPKPYEPVAPDRTVESVLGTAANVASSARGLTDTYTPSKPATDTTGTSNKDIPADDSGYLYQDDMGGLYA